MEKYGTGLRMRLLQYKARGEPTRPATSRREKAKNFVSTKVPELTESVSASSRNCGGSIHVVVQEQISVGEVWLNGALVSRPPARVSAGDRSVVFPGLKQRRPAFPLKVNPWLVSGLEQRRSESLPRPGRVSRPWNDRIVASL